MPGTDEIFKLSMRGTAKTPREFADALRIAARHIDEGAMAANIGGPWGLSFSINTVGAPPLAEGEAAPARAPLEWEGVPDTAAGNTDKGAALARARALKADIITPEELDTAAAAVDGKRHACGCPYGAHLLFTCPAAGKPFQEGEGLVVEHIEGDRHVVRLTDDDEQEV